MTSVAQDTSRPSSTVPPPTQDHIDRGYGSQRSIQPESGIQPGNAVEPSPLEQTTSQQNAGRFNEEWDASQRGSSVVDGPTVHRSTSAMSQGDTLIPTRGGTLKKKASLRRGNSVKRSSSRRSSRAGSVRSLALQSDSDEMRSAFFCPVPTTGNPTDILANRFTAWRKVLKDLITYFREIQANYDHRSKTLLKISNVINNTTPPTVFLSSGGIDDAIQILKEHHKRSTAEANRSRAIEEDVILALTGLRSDLQQKIKEIKNLSGDFKNSVDREMEGTRRAVQSLGDALGQSDVDTAQMTGKQDPYLLKLAVDRQLERQLDEENYLHQAYLNLEASGRELEAIVVGEIQKSYNAYAGILKREADEAYNTVEELRTGPIAMPKDHEWNSFVEKDDHFVDPKIPVRQVQNIYYPGRDHELAQEIRAGLLERKSKYLKSYTAGWYVLSPTHLHEFKSADKTQAPIMSLYLPEQKLGSHSSEGGSSNKFMLKGRQSGGMHRGHSWVFRAETHDTMMAWYEDIRSLIEKTPQERTAFVRQHARSFSGTSQKAPSVDSDGVLDEEDEEPFSTDAASVIVQGQRQESLTRRPEAGGRFPSDIQVDAQRGLQVPLSPSSGSTGFADLHDRDVVAAAADLPGSGIGEYYHQQNERSTSYGVDSPTNNVQPTHAEQLQRYANEDGLNPYTSQPVQKRDTFGNHVNQPEIIGIMGMEAHRDRQASNAPEVATPNDGAEAGAQMAAREAAEIAVDDTHEPSSYAIVAAQEASTIAAPDTDLVTGADIDDMGPFAVGGRSRGQLSDEDPSAPRTFAPEISTIPAGAFTPSATMPLSTPTTTDVESTLATTEASSMPPTPLLGPAGGSASGFAKLETTQIRPSLAEALRAGQHHESATSVSQLHVPGSYPRQPSTSEERPKLPV